MRYRVGDIFVSDIISRTSSTGVAIISKEYELNGLRYEVLFENKQGQKRTYSYTHEELNYHFSRLFTWDYYPVVKQ